MNSSSSLHLSQQDSNNDELNHVQQVTLYKDLCQFEEDLQKLVVSVDKFSPDLQAAQDLINSDLKLYSTLEQLPLYDSIDIQLKQLDNESQEIDERTGKILSILDKCYNNLNKLPMVEQVEFEMKMMKKQKEKIKSGVLLEYAMKLAKFTRVPPTFNKDAIGPNNFIWPAEDAIRRGMLAMASLKSEELTRIPVELNSEEPQEPPQKGQSQEEDEVTPTHSSDTPSSKPDSKSESFEFTGKAKNQQSTQYSETGAHEEADGSIDLDLDLFNPDEF
ncbi:Med4p Ecym_3124 [Eremothecium cymbalariae DBVPG|uniref:Mediator of RNA polymerase II transcription subunit 4 n=1 Tax=Eremothecium cymbalariae (strain CBS 270.75 / DBVPG 7215 / KCTC 17166 / NRRL Y-17582) TaxID=931890 RepID=G8JR59_ERECY|nr:Hypothetical protein Ecym_3124 [Eremothecium cymbalariae DBVPG\